MCSLGFLPNFSSRLLRCSGPPLAREDGSLIDNFSSDIWERGTPPIPFFGSFRGFLYCVCCVDWQLAFTGWLLCIDLYPALMNSPVTWNSCSVDFWGLMPPASRDSLIGWLCNLTSHLLYQSYLLSLFYWWISSSFWNIFPSLFSLSLYFINLITSFIFFY